MRLHVDGKTYEYDEERLTNVEAMAIEKVTGMTFAEWATALTNGSMLATTALVWVVQKRDEPSLRFGEVEFSITRLDVEQDEPDEDDDGVGKGEGGEPGPDSSPTTSTGT